jgi:SagB-type dehydrogenase family enzyme
MPQSELSGQAYHEATKHSYLSVQMNPGYVDGSTQPRTFKVYPRLHPRVQLNCNNPIHAFIRLTSAITFEQTYKGETYQLRGNPSAGVLYPTEVYVQIRGLEGFIDGIYHLEVENNCLTLIYELIDDGLENYVIPNKCINGLIFLVSCVYYRSSWKYQDRSIRYCFLDSGHYLGAIPASAYLHEKNIQLIFDFDKLSLNADLGFENKEFISSCMISEEEQEKPVRRLRLPVHFVSRTDYFQANQFLEDAYQATSLQPIYQQQLEHPQFDFDREWFSENLWNRHSIRRFLKKYISQEIYWQILQHVQQLIPTENIEEIEIYSVVHRVEGMLPDLYKGRNLIKAGDFREKSFICVLITRWLEMAL